MPRTSRKLDLMGAGLSLACGLHCAALTVVLFAMPGVWLRGELLGLPLSWWRMSELLLAGIAFALATWALIAGWRRHRHVLPAVFGLVGMILVTTGLTVPLLHPARSSSMVLAGGIALMVAHLVNRAMQRSDAAAEVS
jgi:hypothetical protein